MMNDPAAALAIGVDLGRRASAGPDGYERRVVLSKANWIAGEASLRLNKMDDARRLIDASYALAKASGDAQSQGNSLLSRGSLRRESGDPAGALQDYLEAYQLFVRTGDARSRSITLQYLSQLYADAQDYPRAGAYLRQAIEAYGGEPMLELSQANSIANLLAKQGQYVGAVTGYRRGLSIARSLRMHNLELLILSNLALAQVKQARLADASQTIDEAMRVSRRTGTKIDAGLQTTIARLVFAQGKTSLARQLMDQVFAVTATQRKPLDADTEYDAYKIYKAAGDSSRALVHLEIAGRLDKEALSLGISTQASLMTARFDFATQNLRISALQATVIRREMALERQAIARQRSIITAVSALVALVMGTLAIWLAALRRSRNQFRVLNAQMEQTNTALEAALREVGYRAQAEHQARQLAIQDPLTGLPNRRFLGEHFQKNYGDQSDPDTNIVVLLLDLDRFKSINDIHGHEVGDLVLKETASRLRAFSAGASGEAVRLGGDEFVVILSGSHDDASSERLAHEIIEGIRAPIYVAEQRLTLGASIGIARSPQDGMTVEDLLRAADIAMYKAKRSGKNTCQFFDPAMKRRQRLRAVWYRIGSLAAPRASSFLAFRHIDAGHGGVITSTINPGLTFTSPHVTDQWRCGPVERPVVPIEPSNWPRLTHSPGSRARHRCATVATLAHRRPYTFPGH